MVRIEAKTNTDDLLVSAFAGDGGAATVVILNRSTKPHRLQVLWPGVKFTEIELVDPYHENDVKKVPTTHVDDASGIVVEPGAIVTLTSTALGQ
jgi:hypothetical protein